MLANAIVLDLRLYGYFSRKTTHWQAFSLRVLGGLCELIGIISLIIGIFGVVFFVSPLTRGVFLLLAVFAFGLMVLGASLILRFKMKSGVIIYHGKA